MHWDNRDRKPISNMSHLWQADRPDRHGRGIRRIYTGSVACAQPLLYTRNVKDILVIFSDSLSSLELKSRVWGLWSPMPSCVVKGFLHRLKGGEEQFHIPTTLLSRTWRDERMCCIEGEFDFKQLPSEPAPPFFANAQHL